MADSTTSKLLSTINKFDRTNWETWAFSIKAMFKFIDTLNIAEGTEKAPTSACHQWMGNKSN